MTSCTCIDPLPLGLGIPHRASSAARGIGPRLKRSIHLLSRAVKSRIPYKGRNSTCSRFTRA